VVLYLVVLAGDRWARSGCIMTTAIARHPFASAAGLVRRHPVASYFVAAYLISWSYWIPLALSGKRVDFGTSVTHVPGLFGPAAAAFLVTFAVEGRTGIHRLLASCVRFQGPWSWIAFATLAPLALFAAATLFVGVPSLKDLGIFGGLPQVGVLPLWFLLLFTSYGEEIGWRGFALPHLQQRRPALSATLLLTCAWAAWHVPTFFALAGYEQMAAATIVGFFLAMLGGAFVLTWMFNSTGGSVLVVALWHASFNLVTATRAGRGNLAAIVSIVVMIFGYALAAADLRARRRGRAPILG